MSLCRNCHTKVASGGDIHAIGRCNLRAKRRRKKSKSHSDPLAQQRGASVAGTGKLPASSKEGRKKPVALGGTAA